MPNLIDPLIEYAELTERTHVEALDEAIWRFSAKPKELTLESYFGSYGDKDGVFRAINELTDRAVHSSCYGSLAYFHRGFSAKVAKRRWYEYHILAARNYQKVFELSKRVPSAVPQDKLYMYVFMAAAEFHNALQHSCAKSLVKEARPLLETLAAKREEDYMQDLNYLLNRAFLMFLEADYAHLGEALNVFRGQLSSVVSNKELSHSELVDLGCMADVAEALTQFSSFVVSGDMRLADVAFVAMDSAREQAGRSGRTDLRYFTDKLRLSMLTLKELSIWNVPKFFGVNLSPLGRNAIMQYIEAKAWAGVYFLFPSQYEALLGGLLEASARRILVSTPTGAGKTVLGELLELSERFSERRKVDISFYMVPTRALANEKYNDFRSSLEGVTPKLRVSQVVGEALVNTKQAIERSVIVILTPVKLDMLLRNDLYGREPITLIIDEFHNIRTGHRGTRIQFDLIRFQERYPEAKIILISAIVSNFDEIKDWFKADKHFRTTWRPTFARVGIFDAKEKDGLISFNDGVSVDTGVNRQVVRANAYKIQAAKLATRLSTDGPCLIFSSSRIGVPDYAKYVSEEVAKAPLNFDRQANSELREKLERLIGKDDEITRYFAQGIGIHRGDLPHILRRIIEDGVRRGGLSVMVSTTTLAEGINLPLKSVIIPRTKVGGEDMPMSLFFNLFGRTGRPAMEAEGQVVLIARKDSPAPSLLRFESAKPKDIERIVTPLKEILVLRKRIEDSTDEQEKTRLSDRLALHEAVIDTVSLALIAEGVTETLSHDDRLIAKLSIGDTGVAGLREGETEVETVLRECQARLVGYGVVEERNSALVATSFGRAVYDTGFSPGSCALLMRKIPGLCVKLDLWGVSKSNVLSQGNALTEILALMEIPIETHAYFLGEGLPEGYADVMIDWMNNKSLADISQEHFAGSYSRALITVEGQLSGFSAWFLYCLWKLILYYQRQYPRRVGYIEALGELPRYSYFGSNYRVVLENMEADLSSELFSDDLQACVKGLSRSELWGFHHVPESLLDEDAKQRLKSLGLRTEESEFASLLHRILKDAQQR